MPQLLIQSFFRISDVRFVEVHYRTVAVSCNVRAAKKNFLFVMRFLISSCGGRQATVVLINSAPMSFRLKAWPSTPMGSRWTKRRFWIQKVYRRTNTESLLLFGDS